MPKSHFDIQKTTNPSSNFLSGTIQRDHNLASDPTYPAPTDYFSYKEAVSAGSLQHKQSNDTLHGGSPNNVLTLQRAEQKRMQDALFPFLVQDKMPDKKLDLETTHLGPGTYSPDTRNMQLNRDLQRSNNKKVNFGSS